MYDIYNDEHPPIFTTHLSGEEITPAIAAEFIRRHEGEQSYLSKLERYYKGRQPIFERSKEKNLSNNKLMTNHAKYIADFSSGYLAGEPVSYASGTADVKPLTDALDKVKAFIQDTDLALDGAIYGRAYELIYADEDANIKLAKLSPLQAFVVYGNTVEHRPVFGVYYYPVEDIHGEQTGYEGSIVTDTHIQRIYLTPAKTLIRADEPEPHYFGQVPLDEIYNNGERIGDFENVLSLIDAYNILQSDRLNDKEQFVNALLVIKGQILGDTDDEAAETYSAIKRNGVMTLDSDPGTNAFYLTRQLDDSSVEVYKTAIVHDIHKISCVPDMSDENFAGNVSGVAMKFKLLALEQMTKIKERYFEEGLRYRLECIANFLRFRGSAVPDTDEITITFTRSLPANLLEDAQVVSALQGILSQKTLLAHAPFVEDAEEEAKAVEKDKQDNIKRQMDAQLSMLKGDMNKSIRGSDV